MTRTVEVYGEIGISLGKRVTAALADGDTTLLINSRGGDAVTGLNLVAAITLARARGRRVTARIEGLAASAASLLAVSCSPAWIAPEGFVMVHEPFITVPEGCWPTGGQREMSKARRRQLREQIVAVYQRHTVRSEQWIREAMAATTWMDADEAIAAGFATAKLPADWRPRPDSAQVGWQRAFVRVARPRRGAHA